MKTSPPSLSWPTAREHSSFVLVQRSMKRFLGLLLFGLVGARLFGAGLIIVGDEEFWRRLPPIVAPPGPRPPHILPPRPVPNYSPLEVSFTKADVRIRDQFATTKVEQEFYNPNPRAL